jgi:hypothetical protein
MRKSLAVLCLVFAAAFVVGVAGVGTADAAPCFYRCICSVPHKCCTSGGVTNCKPVSNSPLQCPQVAC